MLRGNALQQLPYQGHPRDQDVVILAGDGLLQLLSLRRGVVARLDGGDLDAEIRLGLGDAPDGGVEEGFVALGAVDEVDNLHGVIVSDGGGWRYGYER